MQVVPGVAKTRQRSSRKVRRKGKGGAWRALVYRETAGQRRPISLATLAGRYREIKMANGEDFASLQQLGKVATMAGKHLRRKRSAFASRSVLLMAKTKQDMEVEAFVKQMDGVPETEQAWSLVGRRPLATPTLGGIQRFARSVQTKQAKEERKRQIQNEALLSAASKQKHQEAARVLKQCLPTWNLASFQAVPGPFDVCCKLLPEAGMEVPLKVAAWSFSQRRSNLGICLNRYWQEQHEVVMQGKCDQLPPQPPTSKVGCREVGMCICSVEGKQLKHFRDRVDQRTKALMKDHLFYKKVLEGDVVLGLAADGHTIWMHIALLYLSPWEATYHILVLALQPATLGEADFGYTFLEDFMWGRHVSAKPCNHDATFSCVTHPANPT